ncbi:MAG: hypothetical protein SFW09_20175 [Hyphomicrobiaceae bacterium]|nr:hypothetical protein [Hyphomicrobiaceae bacterium]
MTYIVVGGAAVLAIVVGCSAFFRELAVKDRAPRHRRAVERGRFLSAGQAEDVPRVKTTGRSQGFGRR